MTVKRFITTSERAAPAAASGRVAAAAVWAVAAWEWGLAAGR
jgi:hypothetical protein